MDLEQAEKIVNAYGAALASGKEGEMARKVSLLPCDKETIIRAYKLFIAHLIEYRSLDEKMKDAFIVSLSGIGSFFDDEDADSFNRSLKLYRNGMYGEYVASEEYRNFMNNMINIELMGRDRTVHFRCVRTGRRGFIIPSKSMYTSRN